MLNLIPVPFFIILLSYLTMLRYKDNWVLGYIAGEEKKISWHGILQRKIKIIQPATTLTLITAGFFSFYSSGVNPSFSVIILIALGCALGGDLTIIDEEDDKKFMIGLGFFLFTHLFYTAGLIKINSFPKETLFVAPVMLILYILIMMGLWKGLKKQRTFFKTAVFVYTFIICFFLMCSLLTFWGGGFNTFQAKLIFTGAVLFCLGDLRLGIFKFSKPEKVEGFWEFWLFLSPACYFAGQMLISQAPSYF